jgi:catechol 2,3-dioxygenase-like lactoylglutathione lyase family enzyme
MYKEGVLTILASDMKRSIRFYTETLGFKKGPEYGEEWAEVQIPGIRVGFHPTKEKPDLTGKRQSPSIGLSVDDLDEAMDTLKRRGVQFFGVRQDQGGRFAYFADPDGTPLYLIELKYGS